MLFESLVPPKLGQPKTGRVLSKFGSMRDDRRLDLRIDDLWYVGVYGKECVRRRGRHDFNVAFLRKIIKGLNDVEAILVFKLVLTPTIQLIIHRGQRAEHDIAGKPVFLLLRKLNLIVQICHIPLAQKPVGEHRKQGRRKDHAQLEGYIFEFKPAEHP